MFSRLDWSPDGRFLLAPGAMNSGGAPAVMILNRRDWTFEKDIVGFRKSATCVVSRQLATCS